MKRSTDIFALFLILLVFCLFGPQVKAQLFYEGFNNSTGGNIMGIGNFNSSWHAAIGASDLAVTDVTSATSDNYFLVSALAGNPGPSNGYLSAFISRGGAVTTFGAVYTTLASALTIPNGTSITWMMGNASTTQGVRILVQSGGNWYTTDGVWNANVSATNSGADFTLKNSDVAFSYTFSKNGWRAISSLTPGDAFSLGPQGQNATLPSNEITAIGFFMYGNSGAFRLDSLTIVPEPSSLALLGLSVGALGWRRLRRKR